MKTTFLKSISTCVQTKVKPCVMALGFFDGVHLGHKQLIEKAKYIARQKGLELTVLTFFPHPKEVLNDVKFHYLISLERKIEIFEQLGVERLYVIRFDKEFASLEPEVFVQKYLISLQVREVVAGFDFTYGSKGLGTIETLETHGKGTFRVTMIPKVELYKKKISSTYIRSLLRSGKVDQIAYYLGDHYETKGWITHVYELSTLNCIYKVKIKASLFNSLPNYGIYKVNVQTKQRKFQSICFICERKDGEVDVEIDVPKQIKLRNHEKVIIKWLDDLSEQLWLNGREAIKLV
ncbi:FAD synthetase family protein [Bacillus aquiflavi]|uniref:Riboflavin biosynthesis protein n=1 Tax=Bacillus aquiflavi TaxID=2672567 RepID=A0A6B3W1A3_9BACI|nr:FAD synthetase family protein [Bacillus aquiflavi]MBA4537497.1 FAD synthetase family protein [Bacillus aquiflavi]NEY81753.1 FAD synthetase family protein [Bacillus aquiflavi]UAC47462.1 FAD synthetase family protein [Bacillus aquiflavi]